MKILTGKALKLLMAVFCAVIMVTPACTNTLEPKPAEKAETSSPPKPSVNAEGGAIIQKGVPGGIFVNTVEITAKVASISYAKRKATLLGPEGKTLTVKAGPEAVNFDQVKIGDMLDIVLTEELVVALDKDGVVAPDETAGIVALAPKGANPEGVMAGTTRITALIEAVDVSNRTATLLFEDGSTKTVPVRPDIDLSQHKPGEKVVFYITEMVAISLKKISEN